MSIDCIGASLSPATDPAKSGTSVPREYRSGDYLAPEGGGYHWVVDTHNRIWCPGVVAPIDSLPIELAEKLHGIRLVPAGSWSEQAPLAKSPCHTPPLYGCPGCPAGAEFRDMSAEVSWMEAA